VAHVEQLHADAVLGLLAQAPPATPALVVYDGETPANPDQLATEYVLVYLYTTRPDGTALTGDSDRALTRAICHCVGGNAIAARAIAGRVAAALLDVVPTITGRTCWPIRDDGSAQPPRRDQSTGPTVMDQVVVYKLESVPG
jgi:hypothetical protein